MVQLDLFESTTAKAPATLPTTAELDAVVGEPLITRPVFRDAAHAFVRAHHRHLPKAPPGDVGRACVMRGGVIVGVATWGRPVARYTQAREPYTLEVSRCCVVDHPAGRHAPPKLYGAARRYAKAQGWDRVITYTLDHETGVSLRAAGFVYVREGGGGSWACDARPGANTDAPECRKGLWAWPR